MADNAAMVVKADPDEPAPGRCHWWRAGEEGHHLHESEVVEWAGPAQRGLAHYGAALSASVALEVQSQYTGHQPEIWFGANGDWCELDLPQLETVIKELEDFTIGLQALRYRYAAVLSGTDLASKAYDDAEPAHPMEITSHYPAWAECRTYGHTADNLVDRFHCGAERTVELSLHHPENEGPEGTVLPDSVDVVLEQPAYGHLPRLAFTLVSRRGSSGCLSLAEARQLRATLGELIGMAEECAAPEALPPLDSVLADMGVMVAEDPSLDPQSFGYAVADNSAQGRGWICVPRGLSSELREETVRNLLAEVFEGRGTALWEGDAALRVIGDRKAIANASARAAA